MIQPKLYEMSQKANEAIKRAMKKRIPFYWEHRLDGNPFYVSQADLFGNVDMIISMGGARTYHSQNKSRCDKREDICIECIGYTGKTINPGTEKVIPIAGAYWYETGKCWLVPRWGSIDTFNVYLPNPQFVGNFSRYYLDIMFSRRQTWENVSGIHKDNDGTDTYIIFFNYKKFVELYFKTVKLVTTGKEI